MKTPNIIADASLADSHLVPPPRYYTRPNDTINLRVVRRAAKAFFRGYRTNPMRFSYGAGTLRSSLRHANSAAESELTARIANPYSEAADQIDAAFAGKFGPDAFHERLNRALAVIAHSEKRAALAHLSADNHHASLGTMAVNAGADHMTWSIPDCPITPLEYIAGNAYELDRMVPLNDAGVLFVDEALALGYKFRRREAAE